MAGRSGAMFAMARYKKHARIAVGRLATVLAIAAVSACTTGDVFSLQPAVDVGSQTAAVPAAVPQYQGMQRLVPSNPYMTAAYPRMDEPMSPLEQMPASEIDCRSELKRLRVAYTEVAQIHEGQCGIDYPVKVSAIGSIQMKPAATLTCDMAATFAGWTKNELVPSARWRYFSGVKTIHQGSSYSCRNIAGEGVLSEHGKGNALDVMSIELNNGDDIDVRKPGLFAFRTRGFLNTVRADGCQYFTTVLGPGYNYDHRNHFHFDIKNRKSGYRACR
ncbi:extensin-like domain-containing protein [Mesorhizobium sp. LjNodule214]|uniref:extensin-like domain-containing protein n=1 Tax=Mesorhizobium sp. LjNodule214 TaxID=3342252 RepID=UPI003ECE1ABE